MEVLLKLALVFFVAFMACDYTLKAVWKNPVGCQIVAAIFAVLVVLFVGLTL